MRRKDREMDKDFALSISDKCEYATLALCGDRDMPYCIPISIARKGNLIYFHSAMEGRKIEILRKNPCVCLSCVGDTNRMKDKFTTEFESAVIFGSASEVTDTSEKTEALRMICLRHTPENMDEFDEAITKSLFRTAVWRITISQITGKRKKYDTDGKEMKFRRQE